MANEIDVKSFFSSLIEERKADIENAEKELDELEKKNETAETEEELQSIGTKAEELKTKIADLKAKLAEAEAQLAELDNPAPAEDDKPAERNLKQIIEERGAKKMDEIKNVYETKEYRNAWLKRLQGNPLNEVEMRSVGSNNVDVIPTDTLNKIITKAKAIAPLMDEITLLHIAGNVKIGIEGTVNDASLHAQNATITPSGDTVLSVSLGAYEIVKLVSISATVKTMAVPAFEEWLTEQIARKIAEKIEGYIVNGTGSSEPKGVNAETYVAGTNAVKFASATAVTYDEIVTMISLLPQRHNANAKFYMNRKTLWGQVAKVKDDSKYPVFNQLNNTIMGYPVVNSDEYADGEIFFGDMKCYYGNLSQDIKVESSEQSGFRNNAIDYRGTALFDGKVADTTGLIKGASNIE